MIMTHSGKFEFNPDYRQKPSKPDNIISARDGSVAATAAIAATTIAGTGVGRRIAAGIGTVTIAGIICRVAGTGT
jgi:hypothetical protein